MTFSASATVDPGGTYIDTSAAGIYLTPGEQFVIDVIDQQSGTCCNLAGAYRVYDGGDLFVKQGSTITDDSISPGTSMAFETFMDPTATAATPEPGTLALFGSGVLGLVGWARRRRTA